MIMAKRRGDDGTASSKSLHVTIIEPSGLDSVPTDGFLVDGQ